LRGVRGHDDDGFSSDFAGGIGYSLGVVAAGVGDDAAGDLLGRELEDLVGRAADFESADGLQAFGFEIDFFEVAVAGEAGKWARMSGVWMAMCAMRAAAARISSMETSGVRTHGRYFSGTASAGVSACQVISR
jgi:hypothetical protein